MIIGVTGASGFVGNEFARRAKMAGHDVVGFSRSSASLDGFVETRPFHAGSPPDLRGLDAVVHLAGESILGLWTRAKKQRIFESRVEGTRAVVEAIRALGADSPKAFVCASAVGFYGDTGDVAVDESSPRGEGFLADVCVAWEAEAARAADVARTCVVRLGFILGSRGGAMRIIAPVFRSGLGGRLGDGRQWMSAVHVEDAAGVLLHAAQVGSVEGVLNATMPEPATNAEFTAAVARAAHRPALVPAPAAALRLALGEMSQLLLDSSRVLPSRTLDSGYSFAFPRLQTALHHVFQKARDLR